MVADNTWAAMQGRKALKIEWAPGAWAQGFHRRHLEAALPRGGGRRRDIQTGRSDGDMKAAWAGAAKKIEADYKVPFLAHSTMEPPGATIHIAGDRVKLIASLQSPGGASRMINAMTGIPRLNIDIELPRSGGGFGRRLENDFVAEAVLVAQAVKQPVKLLWTRDDDLQNDFFRPFGVQRLRAAADKDGKVTGWSHRVAATSRKFRADRDDDPDWVGTLDVDGFPAACVPNYLSEFVNVEFGLARGWWRAPLHTFAAFATQSFVDEVAVALKRDPLELRLEMLGAPRDLKYEEHGGPIFSTGRLAAVLREAAKRIDYGRKLPQGRGIGLACHFTFGGYAAHAIEVQAARQGLAHRALRLRGGRGAGGEPGGRRGAAHGRHHRWALDRHRSRDHGGERPHRAIELRRLSAAAHARRAARGNTRSAVGDDSRPAPAKWAFRAPRRHWPTRSSPPPASACGISRCAPSPEPLPRLNIEGTRLICRVHPPSRSGIVMASPGILRIAANIHMGILEPDVEPASPRPVVWMGSTRKDRSRCRRQSSIRLATVFIWRW